MDVVSVWPQANFPDGDTRVGPVHSLCSGHQIFRGTLAVSVVSMLAVLYAFHDYEASNLIKNTY